MSEARTAPGILVCVDGSPESDAAVAWAAAEAVLRSLPITLIHVVTPLEVGWPAEEHADGMPTWQADEAKEIIARACGVVEANRGSGPSLEVHTKVESSKVVPALIDAAEGSWMTVVGSTGLGAIGRVLLGSVSTSLLHHAGGPVAVIHTDRAPAMDGAVLVGIDGSPASETATALAFDEASRRGVPLVALHAWYDIGVLPVLGMDWHDYERQGHEVLAERLAGWQEQYPDVLVERRVVCDQPAHWLLREAERAQLVIVGSRGRGAFASMTLGSVSSAVAQAAGIPVIVVRPR
ncbi:MAG: universal stress protein [Mycobacterium sp.]